MCGLRQTHGLLCFCAVNCFTTRLRQCRLERGYVEQLILVVLPCEHRGTLYEMTVVYTTSICELVESCLLSPYRSAWLGKLWRCCYCSVPFWAGPFLVLMAFASWPLRLFACLRRRALEPEPAAFCGSPEGEDFALSVTEAESVAAYDLCCRIFSSSIVCHLFSRCRTGPGDYLV
jgi:hypothetical protein